MPSRKRVDKSSLHGDIPVELIKHIIVPDYVQMRKVKRQRDGLPLYPSMDLQEAQEAFNRDQQAFEEEYIRQERDRKLRLAAEYYGIELDIAQLVTASNLLPGFKVDMGAPKGRPNNWNHIMQYELWFEISQLMKTGEFSASKYACDYLARQKKWVERIRVQSGRSICSNLYEHYMRAKKISLVRFVEWLCTHPNLANFDGDIAAEFLDALQSEK